jgi:hypothetical protein
LVKVYVEPEAPEVSAATVLPPDVNVTVAPAAPLIVPEIEYVSAVAVKPATLALAPLTVTEALVGAKANPARDGVTV